MVKFDYSDAFFVILSVYSTPSVDDLRQQPCHNQQNIHCQELKEVIPTDTNRIYDSSLYDKNTRINKEKRKEEKTSMD